MAETSSGDDLVGIPESPKYNFSPPASGQGGVVAAEPPVPVTAGAAAGAALLAPIAPPRLSPEVPVRPVAVPAAPPRPALRKGALPLVLAAAGIGVGFDALFWGQLPGVNVPLLAATLLATLATFGSREGIAPKWRNVLLTALPLLFFAAMCAVRASVGLTLINLFACIILIALVAIYYGGGDVPRLGMGAFLGAPFRALGGALAHGGPVISQAAGEMGAARAAGRARLLPLLRGLLLAAPVLAVFGALLYSADAVFARLLDRAFTSLAPDVDAETLARRGAIIAGVGYLVAGGLAYALLWHRRETAPAAAPTTTAPGPLGFIEGMVVLGSVTALFAAFVAVQFAYLFGGAAHVLAVPNLTYAEYARRGFAELNWTALLTLALIGGLRAVTRRDGAPAQAAAFKTVGSVLLALTLVLLASAFQRMSAYEAAYGATEMRLYVDGFIVWLGAALVWFGATLWRERLGFGVGAYLCVVGFAATMNLLNPDAHVAARNAARWSSQQRLDPYYLNTLSDDAVPAQLDLYRRLPAGEPRDVLGRGLRDRLDNLRESDQERNWPSANASRARALRLLTAAERELPAQ